MIEKSVISHLIHELNKSLDHPGSIRTDPAHRYIYSTDASIYQIEPIGVAFPRSTDDISAVVEICSSYGVPVIARGAGSGLSGQAIGKGLILDCSRHLTRILDVDAEARTATVEPGVVLNALNQSILPFELQFGVT